VDGSRLDSKNERTHTDWKEDKQLVSEREEWTVISWLSVGRRIFWADMICVHYLAGSKLSL